MAGDQVKKRKKNPPDRKQPTWLFPEEEENPVLNPKPISEEQQRKADTERQNAIDFLKRRAYSVPAKPAPDPQLLNLVAIFLTEYGFNSTCRMFTAERAGRKRLNGWEDEAGGKIKPGMPRLAKIYNDWRKEWEERRGLDMTSSDEDDDAATKREKMIKRRENRKKNKENAEDEQTSSSGSDESSDEGREADVEMKDAPPAKEAKRAEHAASHTSSSTSSSSPTSESDADDEKETKAAKAPSPKPTVNNLVSKLKRKAASGSDPTSDSTDKPINEDKPSLTKKAKLDARSEKGKIDKKVHPDKKVKVDNGDKKAEVENKVEGAKLVKVDKKRKADKKSKSEAGKKATSIPTVASPAGESLSLPGSSSSAISSGSGLMDSTDSPARKPLPASSSSDIDSSSDSKSSPPKKANAAKTVVESTATIPVSDNNPGKTSTDSSATLEDGETKKAAPVSSDSSTSSSSSSSSDSESTPPPKNKSTSTRTTKRKSKGKGKDKPSSTPPPTTTPSTNNDKSDSTKHPKKQNTPFTRIPQETQVDPRVASNAYVPYDYAERAHRDLIVTKGKGFTKEKNKKKRGSYRGGMIDVDGRKGIKFDD